MKKQILFIHSAGRQDPGEGSDGLLQYLLKEAGEEFDVAHPPMPNPDYPEYSPWKRRLASEMEALGDPVIVVGHSLGGSVFLKYASETAIKKKINGLFLIATPFWGDGDWDVEEFELATDFADRLPPIPKIYLYHSLDDDIVPFHHVEMYKKHLPATVVRTFSGNDHSFKAGLPELIDDIKKLSVNGRSIQNKR